MTISDDDVLAAAPADEAEHDAVRAAAAALLAEHDGNDAGTENSSGARLVASTYLCGTRRPRAATRRKVSP